MAFDDQDAKIVGALGFLAFGGVLIAAGLSGPASGGGAGGAVDTDTSSTSSNLCSLCSCNSGVVPCPVDGATLPTGTQCDICGSTDGIVPCLTGQALS